MWIFRFNYQEKDNFTYGGDWIYNENTSDEEIVNPNILTILNECKDKDIIEIPIKLFWGEGSWDSKMPEFWNRSWYSATQDHHSKYFIPNEKMKDDCDCEFDAVIFHQNDYNSFKIKFNSDEPDPGAILGSIYIINKNKDEYNV